MGEIRCIERQVNPNLARYRDSDLRICVALQHYAVLIGIAQRTTRLPLAFVSYDLSQSDDSYLDCIQQLIRQEALLDGEFNYGQHTFTVPESRSTLIPSKWYDALHAKDYLRALYSLTGRECVAQENDPNTKSQILTVFNNNFIKAARLLFPEPKELGFLSVYAILIREVFRVAKVYRRYPVHALLHTRAREFDLCVKNEEGLLFINTFPLVDAQGLLYYTLYALNRLRLDLGSIALFLCGKSPAFNLMDLLSPHIDATAWLPVPARANIPKELPYERYFLCL